MIRWAVLALLLASSIVPSLLLLYYFQERDLYPEPPRVIWATFFLGILSVIPILCVALPLARVINGMHSALGSGALDAFLCAALPEEFFKFLVVFRYASRHKEFNEPMDGIVYGVAASLGFATLENVLYVGGSGMGVALLRALSAVPAHAFTGVVMGYFVGTWRFAPMGRGRLLAASLCWPMLLHWSYDFPLLALKQYREHPERFGAMPPIAVLLILVTLATLILEGRWALRLSRRLRAAQQAGAVQQPGQVRQVGAAQQAAMAGWAAGSPMGRLVAWAQFLAGGVLATGGGLLVLLLAIGLTMEEHKKDAVAILGGGAVIGLLPLLLGLWLFRGGVRKFNRPAAPRALAAE